MIVGVILLTLGGFIAACNWTAPIIARRSGRNVSVVPFIGATLLVAGIYSLTGSVWFALLGIPLDLGTLIGILSLPWLINEFWSTSFFAQLHQFYCQDSGRKIRLDLFRNCRASFTQIFDQSNASEYFDSFPLQIGFSAKWREVDDGFEIYDYADGRRLTLKHTDGTYLASESSIPGNAQPGTLMNGLRFTNSTDS